MSEREREREDPREGGRESERAEGRRKEEGGGRDSGKHNNTCTTVYESDTHIHVYTRQYLTLVGLFQ